MWHVNDEAYTFFYSIELRVRKAFAKGISESNLNSSCDILEDETVKFHWSQLTSDIDETISKKVLDKIVSHYVTITGFSFASSFVELHKQAQGKLLQKGKGLRKELTSHT